MIRRFFTGMGYFGRALGLAFSRRTLLPWVLAPASLTLILTLGGAVLAWHCIGMVVGAQIDRHGSLLGGFLWILALLVAGAGAYIVYVVACLVTTAPFAGLLSERTARIGQSDLRAERVGQSGAPAEPSPPSTFAHSLRLSLRGAGHALVGIALYVAIAVPLFLVHWLVPPLAPLCWIASVLQTALFFAFDGFNEPLHRRGFGFFAKWRFVGAHLAESLGFGLVVAVLMAVPLVSVLVAPLAVVGGTLLHDELRAPSKRSSAQGVL